MNITKQVREFVKSCPFLVEFNKGIGVDHLGVDDTSYMISPVPAKKILKSYIDGSSDRQYVFVFASREAYGPDVVQNLENIGFYEQFEGWLEECALEKALPDLGEGKNAKKIEAQSTGYLYNTEVGRGVYQIQCRLVYYQERSK